MLAMEKTTSTNSGIMPSKTSYTTGHGDGLTFDPYTLNIFDEIQLIIEGKDDEIREIYSQSSQA